VDHDAARLAEQVAEAADAWLRDPRDAGVYQRLVHAIDAWRGATRPQLDLVDPQPSGTTTLGGAGHAEPQLLRGALADVADELRRRGRDRSGAEEARTADALDD
jgi:hypothetical protein